MAQPRVMSPTSTLRPKDASEARDPSLEAALIGEIIQMALSDHVSFADILEVHGLGPDQVKALMRSNLSPGSYRSWRRRVRRFADRRAHYK
jgi:uncharacterized protein (TIGR03643 family)